MTEIKARKNELNYNNFDVNYPNFTQVFQIIQIFCLSKMEKSLANFIEMKPDLPKSSKFFLAYLKKSMIIFIKIQYLYYPIYNVFYIHIYISNNYIFHIFGVLGYDKVMVGERSEVLV